MTAKNNAASWCRLHSLKNKLIYLWLFMLYGTKIVLCIF